eukprot:4628064-Amphidinium_carterae.1
MVLKVVGPYHSGKSFLLNSLMGSPTVSLHLAYRAQHARLEHTRGYVLKLASWLREVKKRKVL